MSGHSHWAGIKRQKGVNDQKRGQVFSKLLAAITIAARPDPNPDFNPRLRAAVLKARENNVPADNIERAITRAAESGAALEELLLEAYGPGGAALIIEAVTDNKNRTIPEVKKVLADAGGKWAESGSVRWAFEQDEHRSWQAKFPQELSPADKTKLEELVTAIEEHADVQKVITNAS